MRKYKPFVLPAAIVLGLALHSACAAVSWMVPYVIFTILLLTFSTIELRKLRFGMMDVCLGGVQLLLAFALYGISWLIASNKTISQGLMMGALCPVASSVTVVAGMLGAKHVNTISFTIFGNLLIAFVSPVVFLFVGHTGAGSLTDSFFSIFGRISTAIGLPFFAMLAIQLWFKPLATKIKEYSGWSFYLWAIALLFTLGQTIDFIFLHGKGNWDVIAILAVGAIVICGLQFAIGRRIGIRYKDKIGGQQLLGQKNTAIGIWMSNTYLNPLASTILAFYSIAQNVLNSWQIWRKDHRDNQLTHTKADG